jgi:acyl transferase domain-containing protein
MIGHTKNAAGIAGLIKATLALHHRTLPPTLANEPNEAARDRSTPFYLNTQARPWFSNGSLRRAAVSAFGFGGTNFMRYLKNLKAVLPQTHSVRRSFSCSARLRVPSWPSGFKRSTGHWRKASRTRNKFVLSTYPLRCAARPLSCMASAAWRLSQRTSKSCARTSRGRCKHCRATPLSPDHRVVSYNDAAVEGKVAFLFPGQGSQTVNMLAELALHFPVVQEAFESADRVLDGVLPEPLTSALFPPPAYFPAEEQEQRAQLNRTEWTQPALGAANCAMLALLRHLGIQPDMLGGHSYGEYVALHAAGVLSFADLMQLSAARGRIVQETQGNSTVGMLAVRESAAHVTEIIAANSDVSIAAQNAPQQTVIGGAVEAIEAIVPHFDAAKISYQRLAVSAGFHVPEARSAAEPLQRVLDGIAFNAPAVPVYSNRTADEYPREASEAKRLLLQHLSETVRFKEQVEQMHEDGARIFIEVGPKAVLSSLVRQTLENQAVIVLPTNSQPASTSMADLLRAVGHLFVSGVALQPERLFSGCKLQPLKIEELAQPTAAPSPATWIVDGGKARPLRENGARNGAAPTGKKRDLPKAAQHAQGTSTQHAISRGPSENFRDQKTQALPKENMTTTPHKGTHPAQPSQPSSVGTSGSRTVTPQTAASQPPTTPPAMPAQSAGVVVDNASAAGVMSAFQASMQSFLEHQSQAQAQRQQLMAQFLQTQQAVVEAYLASASGQPLPQHTAAPQIPTLIQSVAATQQQTYTASQPISQVVAPPVAPAPVEVPVAPNHVAVAQNGTNGYHPPHVEQNGSAAITLTHAAPAPELTQVNTVEPVLHTNNDVAEPVVAAPAETADLQSVVLEMVSEYTGYPIEMLELDQNMEADLGIDSIKRTEIFGGLRDRLGMGGEKFDQEEYFIKIARLRTLQEVIDWLQEEVDDAAVQSSGETPLLPETGTQTALQKVGAQSISDNATTQPNAETAIKDLRRYVIRAEVQPLHEAQRQWDEQQIILVTEDGAGRARELVTALHSGGVNVALVRHAATTRNMGSGVYEADLLSRDSVQQLKALVEEHHGKITALCHLLSLEPHQDTEDGLAVKSLFHLAQAFEAELRAANGTIVAVTGLGGTFGLQGENKVHVDRPLSPAS